jgi:hypothetical protein
MSSIHTGTITLASGGVAQPLTVARTVCRQLFIQCNAAFNVGASTVTTSTGLSCSAASTGAAQNAPHTPVLGSTAASPIINLAEVFCVSATPGAIVNFLYIP